MIGSGCSGLACLQDDIIQPNTRIRKRHEELEEGRRRRTHGGEVENDRKSGSAGGDVPDESIDPKCETTSPKDVLDYWLAAPRQNVCLIHYLPRELSS